MKSINFFIFLVNISALVGLLLYAITELIVLLYGFALIPVSGQNWLTVYVFICRLFFKFLNIYFNIRMLLKCDKRLENNLTEDDGKINNHRIKRYQRACLSFCLSVGPAARLVLLADRLRKIVFI